jgi:flavin reductase (DIM6/NTAB) family NADH-FMN oxidoreductase RutF
VTEAVDGMAAAVDPAMVIVTAAAAGERAGCLVSFSTQCSIRPFRCWVCLSPSNHTFSVATRAATLAVHLLGRDQLELASLFGETTGDEVDKFERCAWHPWRDGTPILDECRSWMVGPVLDRRPVGDHVGMLVEPVDAHHTPGPGALRLSAVSGIRPGHPP